MKKKLALVFLVLILTLSLVSNLACSKSSANSSEEVKLDEKKKKELDEVAFFAAKCGFCHDLDRIEKAKYKGDEWKNVLDRMYQYDNGANLTKEDYPVLLQYLKKTYK
jgi:cytochrome c553